ncbi:phosphotransferase [Mangrovivirga sp. M17]|uniref:Phosphotransferase n=1 Tax=Mangrovivirga halotolerans TaxID=2993936 RepID=A0ABT3RLR6_9BACT|nr:phosphotransferase [Mangrovivirga halotolerans]MCX2742736.1 phosphotransferase [Mangrovivirga halotolerans]
MVELVDQQIEELILRSTHASSITKIEEIQELWSGYGKILRVSVSDGQPESVILKLINFKKASSHPRGWNTNISHERKLHSYEVELEWYKNYSHQCNDLCSVPKTLLIKEFDDRALIILEDLDLSGFPGRSLDLSPVQIRLCLRWLANFHGQFLGASPTGLWEQGSYWHLDTRPDELKAMKNKRLQQAAPLIDEKLKDCTFKTIIHGDAKPANFCFTSNNKDVAAVDFQYVGGGCGMKDIAYLLGACTDSNNKTEKEYLDFYFEQLKTTVKPDTDFESLEAEWQSLYPYAVADFQRFLNGWSPDHWKVNDHAMELTEEVVNKCLKEI